jgi:hypothetical protein
MRAYNVSKGSIHDYNIFERFSSGSVIQTEFIRVLSSLVP